MQCRIRLCAYARDQLFKNIQITSLQVGFILYFESALGLRVFLSCPTHRRKVLCEGGETKMCEGEKNQFGCFINECWYLDGLISSLSAVERA